MSLQKSKNNTGPLSGIRVLDLSRILAGPTCTQLLGDYGADVIKVEKPGNGDDTRAWGPPFVLNKEGISSTESGYYLASNRNKRSLAVDISNSEGVRAIKALLENCDVLIENFKVGSLQKYGLDYCAVADGVCLNTCFQHHGHPMLGSDHITCFSICGKFRRLISSWHP